MDVTVVGSCNIDLISYVSRLPKPGETLQGSRFSLGYGGKGANQCVMSAKLGAKSAMIAKVGKDTFGDGFLQSFKDLDVFIDCVFTTSEAMTGAASICVEGSGQNSIVITAGANFLLNEVDLASAESLISRSKIVVCQLEINPKITLAALQMAKKHNVKTILNPAPAVHLDKEFFTNTDVLCPNETEAEILTGRQVKTLSDAKLAAQALLDAGCRTVIVTLGESGCLVAELGNEFIHICAPKVDVVDTTGAGDCFIGSLAYFMATKPDWSLAESARRAVQIASVSVQKPGTQTSYPTRNELLSDLFSD